MTNNLPQKLKFIKWLQRREQKVMFVLAVFAVSASPQMAQADTSIRPFSTTILQDVAITGNVTDEQGEPLPGATISIIGTKTGTVTDEKGYFRISVPEENAGTRLSVSFIGYATQEVLVGDQKVINISLKPDVGKALNEVVVVGYGTQTRSSLTGAVSQVTAKNIETKPSTNLLQSLQGEAPNLIIQQNNFTPGSGVNINIRGLGTLGDNTPLIVIDGIVGGDINLLNPNDVASVSVLKDAGSAAIYGSRSANGVLLITTKSGKFNQKPTVSYNGNYGSQHPYVALKKVDGWKNAYYKNESLVNSGMAPIYTPDQIQQLKLQGNGDWERQSLLQDAPQSNHTISISGGGTASSYSISAGYQNQASNFVGPDYGYKKYNFRLNQTSLIGKLKVNTILNYVKSQNKSHSNADWVILADADRVPLNYSFHDSAGNFLTNPVASQYNVKSVLEKGGYYLSNNDQVFGSFNGSFNITNDLKLTGILGGTINANTADFRRMLVKNFPSGVYGDDRTVFDNSFKNMLINTQLYAEYNKRLNDNDIKVLLGASNESYESRGFQLQQTLTDVLLGTPTTGTLIDAVNSYNSIARSQYTNESSINSLFGRVSYAFKDRYFLESNFRLDAASRFAEGKRNGFFPSIGASWLVSQENFMQSAANVIGNLKLRASYGILGNQSVSAYQYQTTYFNYPNAYGFNNNVVGGAGYNLGNPDLTWEKSATFNVGVDAGFLDNQLAISVDFFNKVTSDILTQRQDVPLLFGAGFPDYNVAKVKNQGWEATLSYTPNTERLRQSFSFNIGDNKNTLLQLTGGATETEFAADVFSYIRRVGEPITQYYGYKTNGFYQNEDEISSYPKPVGVAVGPGDVKFVDQNKDNIIDEKDKVVLGNPFPRLTFGFNYTVAFQGFDLNLFIQGVGKRDVFLRGEEVEPFHYNYGATMYEHQTDYWTPTNRDARYPRLAAIGSASNTNNWRNGSDLYKYDAAYARLKNINLGYTIPQALSQRAGMQKLRVSLIGQNLLTLTRLKFIDPETSEFGNNTALNSASNSARNYPLPIFYGGGLDITF